MPLVIVDDSAEMRDALDYACRDVRSNGGTLALLRVVEPRDELLASTSALINAEAHDEAVALLGRLAIDVATHSGQSPRMYVREGDPGSVVRSLLQETPEISSVVLAAHGGPCGPGSLLAALAAKPMGGLRVPVTIIPAPSHCGQVGAVA